MLQPGLCTWTQVSDSRGFAQSSRVKAVTVFSHCFLNRDENPIRIWRSSVFLRLVYTHAPLLVQTWQKSINNADSFGTGWVGTESRSETETDTINKKEKKMEDPMEPE